MPEPRHREDRTSGVGRIALTTAVLVAAAVSAACSAASPAAPATGSARASTGPSTVPAAASASSARVEPAHPSSATITFAEAAHQAALVGARLFVQDIPGSAVGFTARPADIYLPPAAGKGKPLPVLVLLHGTPGGPDGWVVAGQVVATMDAFAAAHDGQAPVVVIPDINGSTHSDTECIRSATGGDVETYLSSVVPAWITANLPTSTDHRQWAVAGLSEGATCAVMLALRHPSTYTDIGEFSGLAHLTLGNKNDPRLTTAKLYGGSSAAYDAHDPLWLLAHGRFPGLGAWFECGASDTTTSVDQRKLAAAAQADGIDTVARTVPGAHAWAVWAAALRQALPWWWARFENTPEGT